MFFNFKYTVTEGKNAVLLEEKSIKSWIDTILVYQPLLTEATLNSALWCD